MSGRVRASTVDAYSNGFHSSIVEERTFDRSESIDKVNPFDLHHKYVDVMHLDQPESHLERLSANKLSTLQAAEESRTYIAAISIRLIGHAGRIR